MINQKKMVVSDYDQTFYTNDIGIEKNKLAVNEFEAKGNYFIIATGRSYLDFKEKAEAYHISYHYVILNHGATIIDSNDHVIYSCPIDNKIICKIIDEIDLRKTIKFFCCSALEKGVDIDCNNITKMHLRYHTREEAREISKLLNDKFSQYINAYWLMGDSVEVISNKVNKSSAIRLLAQKFNINDTNIYTIGDGFSDIEMVKDFNGFCMEESVDELKQVAIKEYKSVSELLIDVM